jgi:hypothetical protein
MLKTISSITNALGALNYKGTWNALTNSPTLADGTGAKGDYYVTSTAGTQTFGGLLLFFGIGDWIVYNGAVWQRVEGGSDGNFANITLNSTDAGANAAPLLDLYRDSASPAVSDTLGEIEFNGEDSAGNKQQYGLIHASIISPTSGSEGGQLHFETATAGVSTEKMIIGTSNLVINEIGAVYNVRIEGDTDANLFYTDATNSRVGIGTISPSSKLTVNGGQIRTLSSAAFAANPLDNGSFSGEIIVNNNDGSGDLSGFALYTNSSFGTGCGIFAKQTASTTSDLVFYTGTGIGASNTEKMRITSAGNVLVGATTAGISNGGIHSLPDGNGAGISFLGSAGNSASDGAVTMAVYSTSAAQFQFYVGYAGTVFARSIVISALSDARLKENIVDLDVGIDAIMALKPRKFDWKEGQGTNKKNVRGFIAQELEEVFPDLIDEWRDPAPEGEEPYRSVRQDLMPVLVKAMQEQQALITSLTARIEALENK